MENEEKSNMEEVRETGSRELSWSFVNEAMDYGFYCISNGMSTDMEK